MRNNVLYITVITFLAALYPQDVRMKNIRELPSIKAELVMPYYWQATASGRK